MNFLAHAHLSGADKKILVGNLIGDFVKGRQKLNRFETQIVKGVELHRAIDEFTDNHPLVHQSKDRLRPAYRHYAGVIVDVFYDHYLATHWDQFHHQTLEAFAANTYATARSFSEVLPPEFNHMLTYMIAGNWLVSYRDISGVHRALSGMAQRSPYNSKMERASTDLRNHYDQFRLEFENFFPQLKAFAEEWLRET